MNKNFKKGFTLIELLVVIAIIGILAAVVIASLNSARSKGADAAKKANLSNARAQAELFFEDTATVGYTNVCTAAGGIGTMVTAAGGVNTGAGATCHSNATAYKATAPLTTSGQHWCIDSLGASKQVTAAATAVGAC